MESSVPRSSRAYWACQFGGWGLYSAAQLLAAVALLKLPWIRAALDTAALNGIGLVSTHQLHAHILRNDWKALQLRGLVPRVAAASLLLAAPMALLAPFASIAALQSSEELIHELAPAIQPHFSFLIRVVHQWINWALLFAIWLGLYFSALSIRRRRYAELRQSELTRMLQQAELRLLKSQLNPHFLFNALNTVRSLIADNPQAAQTAVTHFANTLRYALSAGQQEMVPLSKELEIVRDYLQIESLRFEDRLSVDYNVSDEAGTVPIPAMLLQTLVENAIKHGIADLPRGGRVKIEGTVGDGMLLLEVQNSRRAGPARQVEGTGLRNSAERLRLIFGPRASITLDLSQPDTAAATVHIPVSI
jgi:two-component system sensor histidine kinase AlgZ